MSTVNFIVYGMDGEIIRTGACPQSMIGLQMDVDNFVLEGEADDVAQYVDMTTHTVANKRTITPVFSKLSMIADGVDTVIITELPVPCIVSLDDFAYNVPDGVFEFTVDIAGTYTVRIDSVETLSYEEQVIAT